MRQLLPTKTAKIAIRPEFGWRQDSNAHGIELWIKGYGRVQDSDRLAKKLAELSTLAPAKTAAGICHDLDGHFAFVAKGPGWLLAAVDRVRSTPLAYARESSGWIVDGQAERLRARLGLEEIDEDAGLALAMAGYTIDTATLCKGIHQLGPGEFVLFREGKEPERTRYYTYSPWRADKPPYDGAKARRDLAEITLGLIDGMMRGLGDRVLAVPLSAGRDSRLIVSAARHLGYDNVRTFSYGRAGNHEAKASQAIAERLGYQWQFVPVDLAAMRRFYASDDWKAYYRFADSLQSTPFVQDLPQVRSLKEQGYLPGDAVICNGNSGDFISGNHIVAPMDRPPDASDPSARLDRITDTLFMKHFALWDALRTPENRRIIIRQLECSIERAGAMPDDQGDDFGIYEYAEFQDRQTKFVISGQRIYEYLGHDWRMPLWDNAYLDFFEKVPLEGKRSQSLYAEMLERENWGGVWQGIPVNAKTIRPQWIRPVRFLAKVAHAPLGTDAWHRFERRYFQYWMTSGAQSAIQSYKRVARDRRGARNAIAWLTEDYLNGHGLDYGGRCLQAGGRRDARA